MVSGPLDPDRVASLVGARRARVVEKLQTLWSGYGAIFRVELDGHAHGSAIVKWVVPPRSATSAVGHARKCRSYDVEIAWYRGLAAKSDDRCRVARFLGASADGDERLLVLEDLDAAGYGGRRLGDGRAIASCVDWLAELHARFLGVAPDGLWATGSYWHLATRREELEAVDDPELRRAAPRLDRALEGCAHRTIVHGDAKLANFCFRSEGDVAAVDFQYVGGGCGMRDLAYLVSGEPHEDAHVDRYFERLRRALGARSVDASPIEDEWRSLYPIACADFYRFLAGWSKGAWKRDHRAQALVADVLRRL